MKRAVTKIISGIRNSALSIKLTLVFAGLFFLLSGVISAAVYYTSARSSMDQITYSASQSFDQAMIFVDGRVQSALYAAEIIRGAVDAQQIIENSTDSAPDLGDEYRAMRRVWDVLLTLETGDIQNVRLYVGDGFTYSQQGVNFDRYSAIAANPRYARLFESTGQPVWFPPYEEEGQAEPMISLMRVIFSREGYDEPSGALSVRLPVARVAEILEKSTATESGLTVIVNEQGEIIAGSRGLSALGEGVQALNACRLSGEWQLMNLGAGEYLARAQRVPLTDWRMIALIPIREMRSLSYRTMLAMLAWLLPLLLVGFALVWLLIGSVTRRVSMLSARMAHVVRSGDLDDHVEVGAQDEIGQLCVSFNAMVDSLRRLVHQQYEDGKAIKQAELRALQAQINPHFLYNTLDLMNWQAMDAGAPELAELTHSMARFYRLSLAQGRDFVRLGEELDHVSVYVRIQNMRFAGAIGLRIDVSDEVRALEVLKLMLQPLVENCVLHGMASGAARTPVTIDITARAADGDLTIEVRDDGVGMDSARLKNVLNMDAQQGRGFGVMNIHHRLRLCYGEGYGLTFQSDPGAGTRVLIRLPARRKAG